MAGSRSRVNNDGLHWRSQDLSMWLGQRAYVEILDDGPGYAALAAVAFSDTPAPPTLLLNSRRLRRWRGSMRQRRRRCRNLAAEFHKVEASLPAARRALATADGSRVDEHVFIRGSSAKLGASRAAPLPGSFRRRPHAATPERGSGRLELARQIDRSRARRRSCRACWSIGCGSTISSMGSSARRDDFGVLGQAPTHPELLDFLANQFVKQGWSLKKMHRLMVLSSTYRMASRADAKADEADPENKLLHRMPIRRLEAEAIRDALLAVSGRLDPARFGPPVMAYLTPFMVGRGRPGVSGPLDGKGRRSIYLAVRRNFLNPMFLAFDYPTPFSTRGRRSVSNVPAQALTMMNNPLVVQQAERWAKRMLDAGPMPPRQRWSACTRRRSAGCRPQRRQTMRWRSCGSRGTTCGRGRIWRMCCST